MNKRTSFKLTLLTLGFVAGGCHISSSRPALNVQDKAIYTKLIQSYLSAADQVNKDNPGTITVYLVDAGKLRFSGQREAMTLLDRKVTENIVSSVATDELKQVATIAKNVKSFTYADACTIGDDKKTSRILRSMEVKSFELPVVDMPDGQTVIAPWPQKNQKLNFEYNGQHIWETDSNSILNIKPAKVCGSLSTHKHKRDWRESPLMSLSDRLSRQYTLETEYPNMTKRKDMRSRAEPK